MRRSLRLGFGVIGLSSAMAAGLLGACGGGGGGNGPDGGDGGSTRHDTGGPPDAKGDTTRKVDSGLPDPGINFGASKISTDGADTSPIPTTCSDSINRHSYIGCDYWPTVTVNPVYS